MTKFDNLKVFFLILISLLLVGCGGGGSDSVTSGTASSGGSSGTVTSVGTVRIQSILARSVPQAVTDFRVSGFDSNGGLLYGPVIEPKAATLELVVPTAVVRIQLEYLIGADVVGLASIPVTVVESQTTEIANPEFQDVDTALTTLSLSHGDTSIAKGTSLQITASGALTSGSQSDFTSLVTWASTQPGVATVSSGGVVSSVSEGQTNITATFGTTVVTVNLTVTAARITQISITPSPLSLAAGSGRRLQATATFTDGTQQDVSATAQWSSDTPGVAVVDATGGVSTTTQGSANVSAALMGVTGQITVTVTPAELTGITITPGNPSLAKGTNQQLTATGVFTDMSTQDLTNSATWSVVDTGIANVTPSGLLTGAAEGSTQVGAQFQGVQGQTSLTVTPAVVTSVVVTPGAPSLPAGTSVQLTATANFSDGSQQDVTSTATWLSSQAGVATVTPVGLVAGATPGQSTVTATFSGQQGQSTVDVTPAVVTGLTIAPTTPSLALGTSVQFTATATFSDSSTQDVTNQAAWLSSVPGVASVNPQGLAASVSQGQTNVQATFMGQSDNTLLSVTPAVITRVDVTPGTPSVANGLTQQFTAVATFSDNSTQNITNSASWSSSAPAVATINPAGLSTTLSTGQTVVTAQSAGVMGTATLQVTPAIATALAITPNSPSTPAGTTVQFTATASFSDGSSQNVTNLASWTSSQVSVAGINTQGLASTSLLGTTNIQASFMGQSDSTTLNVTAATVARVDVTPTNPSIPDGTTQQFTATATFTDNSTQDVTSTAMWTSSLVGVATVNGTGLATGQSAGGSTITAAFGGQQGSTSLTVTAAVITSISVTPNNPTINDFQTQQFTATGTFSDASTQDVTNSATWSSTATGVATVNTAGLATGVSAGSTTIQASIGAVSGNTTLTVTPSVTVQSVAVTPNNPTINDSSNQQFTATATLSDLSTQDVTNSASWSSSAPAVASVSTTGLATGVSAGSATIQATFSGVSGMTTLTVTPTVTVQSIALTPTQAKSAPGTSRQYRAIATFSDTSTQDVTSTASWSSNNTDVTVSASGLATVSSSATRQTTATITATFGGVNSTAALSIDQIVFCLVNFPGSAEILRVQNNGSLVDQGSNVGVGSSQGMAIHPTGRYAYFTQSSTNQVLAFEMDNFGGLTAIGTPLATGTTPVEVAVDPSGRFVYVVNSGSHNISAYTIGSNGGLTANGTFADTNPNPAIFATSPTNLAVSPNGTNLYVSNRDSSNVSVFTISGTGTLSWIDTEPCGLIPSQLALTPNGAICYVADSGDATITILSVAADGSLSLSSTTGVLSGADNLAVEPSGRFLYVSERSVNMLRAYSIGAGGALTSVGVVATDSSPIQVVADSSGRYVYVTHVGSPVVNAYTINANGTLTANGSTSLFGTVFNLAITP